MACSRFSQVAPGTMGTPASCISSRAAVFEPMASMAEAGGPMNAIPACSHPRANSAFSDKNRSRDAPLRLPFACGFDDQVATKITLRSGGWPQPYRFVRHPHMLRRTVCVAVHRHRTNAHLPQRPDDPTRDFSTIRNENLFEHAHLLPCARPRENPFESFSSIFPRTVNE